MGEMLLGVDILDRTEFQALLVALAAEPASRDTTVLPFTCRQAVCREPNSPQ